MFILSQLLVASLLGLSLALGLLALLTGAVVWLGLVSIESLPRFLSRHGWRLRLAG